MTFLTIALGVLTTLVCYVGHIRSHCLESDSIALVGFEVLMGHDHVELIWCTMVQPVICQHTRFLNLLVL